ncbi:MAG: replication initiation factor domain-containing protein [Burkholderiaceae bacterium]
MKLPHILPLPELAGSAPQARTDGSAPARRPPAPQAPPPTVNKGGKIGKSTYTYIDPETGEIHLICPTGQAPGACTLIPISSNGLHPYAAITDYLNCTFKFDPEEESFAGLFQELFDLLGEKFAPAVDRQRGLHKYQRSFQLGESTGILCIGGQAGTVLVSLPGTACSLIQDWAAVVDYFANRRRARITRWDGAVDDYSGSHSVDWAVEQYLAGAFGSGGNKPTCGNAGNWTDPDGKGRTFYVGKRKNGKMIRVYEKGQQLGALWHPWVRWEVELHNKDRVVPWEVLLDPARYFVGSYPHLLTWVQEEMTLIRTIQKQMRIGYDHLTSYAALAYGPLLNVMLEVEGSPEAVLEKLRRDGTPRRLQHPCIDKPSDLIK